MVHTSQFSQCIFSPHLQHACSSSSGEQMLLLVPNSGHFRHEKKNLGQVTTLDSLEKRVTSWKEYTVVSMPLELSGLPC